MMDFFFSEVAGCNLSKKRLHERFVHAKFVRTCRNSYLLGQLLMNDSVSFRHLWDFISVLKAVAVFLPLHLDSCPCAALSKQYLAH